MNRIESDLVISREPSRPRADGESALPVNRQIFRTALRRAPTIFLIGAIIGTLGDMVHSHFGAVRYPQPIVWGEAWWVPILMGGAALLFVETHAILCAALGEDSDAPDRRRCALAVLVFGAGYIVSGVFRAHSAAVAIAFLGMFVLRGLLRPRSRVFWAHGIGLGLFGILFETALAWTGAFEHTSVDILGVPYWLGPFYLHAAVCAREVDLLTRGNA